MTNAVPGPKGSPIKVIMFSVTEKMLKVRC